MKIYGPDLAFVVGPIFPLSPAIEVGDLVFLSGQVALRDGAVEGDVAEQTHVVFDSIDSILGQAGLTLGHIVKATVWLTDPKDFAAFNVVYCERLKVPYPARSCVISQLALAGARLEIEVIANRSHMRS
jgi:2-iminobutanoate/2-iminopropanoate deaminase